MNVLKKQWLVIRSFLEGLPRDTKILMVTLALFLGLIGFVMMQYAASSEMVPLKQVAAERQDMVLTRLGAAGIQTEMRGGMIMVAKEKQTDALAVLAQDELLAPNTQMMWDDMIKSQSPWNSDRQNKQMYNIALQKVLAQVIGKMQGVQSADVVISMPENTGFGRHHTRPSASVTVSMRGSAHVNRRQAAAIAGMVSGAVAEMRAQDVIVIDASSGQKFTGKDDSAISPEEGLDILLAKETYYREKIERSLAYIPGVIVEVNIQSDAKIAEKRETFGYSESEPMKRVHEISETRESVQNAGEAGARPNTGITIDGGSGTGMKEEKTESETEFGEKLLQVRSEATYSGGVTKEINVTIGVPRPYFVSLYQQGKTGDEATKEPDEAAMTALKDAELLKISSRVEPLVKAEGTSVVRADMIPDPRLMLAALGGVKQEAGGMLMMVQQDWFKTAGLAALALLSLGIMFGMVRKATQQPQLPTVEELAGVPPMLPVEDDLVGEASEEVGAMAGVEVDEDELRSRQIAQQISDLVKGNPTEAANLVGRWLRTEEH